MVTSVTLLPKRHNLHLTVTKPPTPTQRDFVQKDGPGNFKGVRLMTVRERLRNIPDRWRQKIQRLRATCGHWLDLVTRNDVIGGTTKALDVA